MRSGFRASFDCDRAATDVERAICDSGPITRGDFEMGVLYRRLLDRLPAGALVWQATAGGLLFEQAYTRTRTAWPADVEFRYTDMVFVGSELL